MECPDGIEKRGKMALLVFLKNAQIGKVKTRIAVSLGVERALDIYKTLVNETFAMLSELDGIDVVPFFSDFVEPMDLDNSPCSQVQSGEGLGQRMGHAFSWAFSSGYDRVGIIGTDCPELTHLEIRKGLEQLADYDFCVGPAYDGGYYFLSMRQFQPWVFDNITWGSSSVLEETIAAIESRSHRCFLLDVLRDVDTEEDYLIWLAKKELE